MRKSLLIKICGMLLIMLVYPLSAQEMDHNQTGHTMVLPDDIQWQDAPASIPKGAKVAVLEGDLSKEGPFTFRVKFPANYKLPPHSHPGIEHVTVISGAFIMGFNDTFDESIAKELVPGSLTVMQKGTKHFAFTKEETVVQVHGIGPWGITYVNPNDDPRNNQKEVTTDMNKKK